MTTPGDVAAADTRLTAWAAELASAEGSDPPDTGRLAAAAWAILSELNEATYGRIDAERTLIQALTAAQASVAGARAGSADPLAHIRGFLAAHGKMPPAGVTSLTLLAWQGTSPADRAGSPAAACRRRAAGTARRRLRGRGTGS